MALPHTTTGSLISAWHTAPYENASFVILGTRQHTELSGMSDRTKNGTQYIREFSSHMSPPQAAVHDYGDIRPVDTTFQVQRAIRHGSTPVVLGRSRRVTEYIAEACTQEHEATGVFLSAFPDIIETQQEIENTSITNLSHTSVKSKQSLIIGTRTQGPVTVPEDSVIPACITAERAMETDIEKIGDGIIATVERPTIFSIHLNAIDPAHAPAVTDPVPAGFSATTALALIACLCRYQPTVIEVSGYAPEKDNDGLTAYLAAMIVHKCVTAITQ